MHSEVMILFHQPALGGVIPYRQGMKFAPFIHSPMKVQLNFDQQLDPVGILTMRLEELVRTS